MSRVNKHNDLKVRRAIAVLICVLMVFGLAACSANDNSGSTKGTAETISQDDVVNPSNIEDLKIDNSKWQYDEDNDVYYQIGISYCTDAEAEDTEKLAIYVPGAYMSAKANGDGTYTCTVNNKKKVNGYTASTAPIVMPVNTPGYSSQSAATEYSYNDISKYIKAGYIYVLAGTRGRNFSMGGNGGMKGGNGKGNDDSRNDANLTKTAATSTNEGINDTSTGDSSAGEDASYETGAPWGVTDLKAAVRYLRYNKESLAGDTDRIFAFGHSGGGAQSSVFGASGDSSLYYNYLQKIGAAMKDDDGNYISDAIAGVMAWCPITDLDSGNEAYEWMMGQYSSDGTRSDSTWTGSLSDDLAEAYARIINDLGLTDSDGNKLTLEASKSGIYTNGTYYEYLKETIETSLNNFLEDTEFPYTTGGSREMAGMEADKDSDKASNKDNGSDSNSDSGEKQFKGPDGNGGPNGNPPSGEKPSGNPPSGSRPDGNTGNGNNKGGMPGWGNGNDNTESTTYKNVKDYIKALNEGGEWIKYDSKTKKATITSVEAFVTHCKNATKNVGAFDATDASQTENEVFGMEIGSGLHFDTYMANIIKENADEYSKYDDYGDIKADDYSSDLEKTDSIGNNVTTRSNMYNPMYYISSAFDGAGTSTLAKYWRINTGIEQGDTSLTTEMNLALALEQNSEVEDIEFTTVWEQGHTMAERTGDGVTNMIKWIDSICK